MPKMKLFCSIFGPAVCLYLVFTPNQNLIKLFRKLGFSSLKAKGLLASKKMARAFESELRLFPLLNYQVLS